MLGKLTAGGMVCADVSAQLVEDALAVCAAFNMTERLADAFGFEVLRPGALKAGAKYLLERGYRLRMQR